MLMKKTACIRAMLLTVATSFAVLIGLVMILSLGSVGAVYAQGPTSTPTLTYQQSMNLAKQYADDALDSSNSALGNVLNASSAVKTSNNALTIAIGAGVVGTALIIMIVLLALVGGVRSFREARSDLAAARIRLADMRSTLKTNTEMVHQQAERAIQSLAATQLGEQQLALGNIQGAMQLYRKAYSLDPKSHTTHYFLGELYIQDRQYETGIKHIQELIAEMEYVPAEASLGLALYLQGDQVSDPTERALLYVQAEERLLQALQKDPSAIDLRGVSIQEMLGGLYKRQGRYDQAISYFEEARKVTPENNGPLTNLALMQTIKGNLNRSLPIFAQIEQRTTGLLAQNPYNRAARADHFLAGLVLEHDQAAQHDLDIFVQQHTPPAMISPLIADLRRLQQSPRLEPTFALAIAASLTRCIDRLERLLNAI